MATMTNSTRTSSRPACRAESAQSDRARRASRARRLQQPQRPPEPVQPDRPHLEQPPRRDRPDFAGRLRSGSSEVAKLPAERHFRLAATTACRSAIPTVDADCHLRAGREAPPTTARGRPSPHSTSRTKSACRRCSSSSPACASTASSSPSTISTERAPSSAAPTNCCSPRLGLIFKPLPNLSLYASYSRSYLPQSGDQFSGLTLSTEALKPERFDNYELGAKWEPIAGLLATAAIYRLDRTNTRATGPVAWHRGADRRAAQPRARAWAGAQRQRPLADFGRLCLAGSGGHRSTTACLARRLRSAARPAPHLLAVEPL